MLDHGSISAAAGVLGYTQSAVSQQLAALEREIGAPLVDRSHRPLRPTRAGALLQPHVERALAALGGAEAAAQALHSGTPRLRLAAFPSALASFVPAAIRDLRRVHDPLVVEVLELEPDHAVEHLRSGEADVAVIDQMPGLALPDTSGLQRRRLLVDHVYIVLPAGHRLARQESVSITDLEGEPLTLPHRHTPTGRFRSLIEQLCADAGFSPQVDYELDELSAVLAFAAAGIAIAPIHGLILSTLRPGATARPLAERPNGSRTVDALAPATAPTQLVDDMLQRLADAGRAYRVNA